MKKVLKFIVLLIILSLLSVSFVACDDDAHTHTFSPEFTKNQTQHWRECECGEKSEIGDHVSSEWITTVEATEADNGSRHKVCTICEYKLETEVIPATHKSLTMEETKELLLGTDLIAAWQGFTGGSVRQGPILGIGIETVELTITAKGKTVDTFEGVEEVVTIDGLVIVRAYMKNGVAYTVGLDGTGNYLRDVVPATQDDIDSFYFNNVDVTFLFNESNFENLFKSADKITANDGSYTLVVHVDIEDYLRATIELLGTSGEIPPLDGEVVFTFNFDSEGLKSFDLVQRMDGIDVGTAYLERFEGNIDAPAWFDEDDFIV